MRWFIPFSDVERLSDEKIRKFMERDKDGKDADAWNRSVYTHMSTQKSLRLLVGYDIFMEKGKATPNSQRIHSACGDIKFRYFRRWLSMLVPSAVLLLAWAGIPPEMEFHLGMRYRPKIMHVFYTVAFLLRDTFDLHPARAVRNGMNCHDHSGRVFDGSADDKAVMNLFFDLLVPGKTSLYGNIC